MITAEFIAKMKAAHYISMGHGAGLSRGWCLWLALIFCAMLCWGAAAFLLRDAPEVLLRAEQGGGVTRFYVNNRLRFEVDDDQRKTEHGAVGLYAFNFPGDTPRRQAFSHIMIRQPIWVERLAEDALAAGIGEGDKWRIAKGRLEFSGREGERAVYWLPWSAGTNFRISARLHNAVDGGLLVAGDGIMNGLVCAVRPARNDVLLFRLEDGQPGPLLGCVPFDELSVWKEGLRFSGRLARSAVLALLFAGIAGLCGFCYRGRKDNLKADCKLNTAVVGFLRRSVVVWLFLIPFVTTAVIHYQGYGAVPHIPDETAYVMQARIFAQGRLRADMPRHSEFFPVEHMVMSEDGWFSKYPPLFSFLLAIGLRLGIHGLINPVLSGICAVLVWKIAGKLAGATAGMLAWCALATSPFFLFMGGSLMAHMTSAVLAATGLYAALLYRDSCKPSSRLTTGAPSIKNSAASVSSGGRGCAEPYGSEGFCKSLYSYKKEEKRMLFRILLMGVPYAIMLWVRPYTAVLLAASSGLLLFTTVYGEDDRRRTQGWCSIKRLVVSAGVYTLPVLFSGMLFAGWNRMHSGVDAGGVVLLHQVYEANDSLGFGPDKGLGWLKTWGDWGHTPAKGLRSAWFFLRNTDTSLLGWPLGLSMVPVLLSLIVPLAMKTKPAIWLFSQWLVLVAGHMFYWATQHLGYGARYWFESVPALLVLAGCGLAGAWNLSRGAEFARRLTLIALVVVFTGYNLFQEMPRYWREAAQYGGINNRLERELAAIPRDKSMLVFVSATPGPRIPHLAGFHLNDPWLRSVHIVALDRGDENRILQQAHPEHRPYSWNGKKLVPLEFINVIE